LRDNRRAKLLELTDSFAAGCRRRLTQQKQIRSAVISHG
jgi:hypothetical protein